MTSDQWKSFERDFVAMLKHLGMIDEKFTGQLTLHFNEGGLSDFDKIEKSLKKKIEGRR